MFCTAYSETARSECKQISLSLFLFLVWQVSAGWASMHFARLLFHASSKKHCFSSSLLKTNNLHFQRSGLITLWQWVEDTIAYGLFFTVVFLNSSKCLLWSLLLTQRKPGSQISGDSGSFSFLVQSSVAGCACTTTVNHNKIWTRKGTEREFIFTNSEHDILVWWNTFSFHS